jgi:hypothetical protein
MHIRISAATAVLIALAACGSSAGKGDAGSARAGKSAAAAAAAAETVHFTPGEWESTVEMTGMNIPNLPPQYARMNRGMTSVHKSCMSPRDAARPRGDFFAGRAGGQCHYSDYSLAGGKLHAVMTCAGAGNTSTIVRTDGQYDAASFDVRSSVETKGGAAASTMQMHVTARRVGDCAPGGAK